MADESIQIPVEHDLRPGYYDRFRCLMGDCVYNCCQASWQISFNKRDYLALKRVKGSPELNASLKSTLRRVKGEAQSEQNYGEFVAVGGKGHCPLQREDGLCSLQMEKGAEALPEVCRTFPRGEAPMLSGFWERSLSPACEGVLELLWELPGGVEFVSDLLPEKQRGTVTATLAFLRPRFQEIRSRCIDLLQNRSCPLPQRILLLCTTLQELAEGKTEVESWLARTGALAESPRIAETLRLPEEGKTLPLFLSANLKLLSTVSNEEAMFGPVLDEVLKGLGVTPQEGSTMASLPLGPYLAARARFAENFQGREYFMENLMVSLFFHIGLPDLNSGKKLWESCVRFCNLYSFYRFLAVMSCREGAAGDKAELFRMLVYASRKLLHSPQQQTTMKDELFENESATLAHMAILLGG